MDLINQLIVDSSISIPVLSKKTGVNTSVLYSRINRLVHNNIIEKFTISLNRTKLGFSVKAFVGINIEAKFKDNIYNQLINVYEIMSVSQITGRFDAILTIYVKNLQDLHTVINEKLNKINGITNTEIFIELQNYQNDRLH
ncbi:MAG: Lrp/AsnC family transcriptional regulator [Nitrosopumilaceae archaeon]|nr:Lrp/AsnC family transcriptional regulator [Nitrosopumilaceae archaeon]